MSAIGRTRPKVPLYCGCERSATIKALQAPAAHTTIELDERSRPNVQRESEQLKQRLVIAQSIREFCRTSQAVPDIAESSDSTDEVSRNVLQCSAFLCFVVTEMSRSY